MGGGKGKGGGVWGVVRAGTRQAPKKARGTPRRFDRQTRGVAGVVRRCDGARHTPREDRHALPYIVNNVMGGRLRGNRDGIRKRFKNTSGAPR